MRLTGNYQKWVENGVVGPFLPENLWFLFAVVPYSGVFDKTLIIGF